MAKEKIEMYAHRSNCADSSGGRKLSKKILRELVKAGKEISRHGLIIGEGGNISARSGNIIFIKKRGAAMGRARETDYIPLDIKKGQPLRKKDSPSTEIYMHLACYRMRKDIGAVIHVHPVFATALSAADVNLGAFSYEAAVSLNSSLARIGYVKPGTPALGRAIGRAVKKHNAILLKNHGLVTVGKDLSQALLRAVAVERAALSYICCKGLGKVGFLKKKDFAAFCR